MSNDPNSSRVGREKDLIYIAVADRDFAVGEKVAHALSERGFHVTCRHWIQQQSSSGWDEEVEDALKRATKLVLLLSKASMPYDKETKREWFYFDQLGKPIHPVLLEDCDIHSRLFDCNYVDARTGFDKAMSDLSTGLISVTTRPHPPLEPTQRVFVVDSEVSSLRESLQRLRSILVQNIGSIELSRDQLSAIVSADPRTADDYQLGRVAEWIQSPHRLNARFVDLTLMIDRAENLAERWLSLPEQYKDLGRIIKTRDEQAFVLLGAPGSGKTTLLRHLQLDHSIEALRDGRKELAVIVNLSQYDPVTNSREDPEAWLDAQFQRRFPNLPSISQLLRRGELLLLLDGLNELPHDSDIIARERVGEWKNFLISAARAHPRNRFVFSCRTLDYSAPLSTPAFPVPHIRIEPMNDQQVQEFLQRNASFGPSVWSQLVRTKTLDYLRTPYLLQLLVDQLGSSRGAPAGRADILSVCVGEALHRELQAGNHRITSGELLTERDRLRLTENQIRQDLECDGPLLRDLARLAIAMQKRNRNREALQVRIPFSDARDLIGERGNDTIAVGCAIGVLEQDVRLNHVFFTHQLMQEYFAGRAIAVSPEFELARAAWRVSTIRPSLQELLGTLSETEELPPLPTTGWEETFRFAATLAHDQDTFVTALSDVNLQLAAECATQPDVRLSSSIKIRLRELLQNRATDADCDLRARLSARRILAELGDPAFRDRTGQLGAYLEPEFLPIPYGEFVVGSEEPNEAPIRTLTLGPFELAKFPVTNAEYKLFIEAGGYDNYDLWVGPASLRWLKGEGLKALAREEWAAKRGTLRQRPNLPLTLYRNQRINLLQAISFTKLSLMSDAQFERLLGEWYSDQPHKAPRFWQHSTYNHPSQPVVGVSWYEAAAYSRWLSIQTGWNIRLPTEIEWEAAARGFAPGKIYPYGDLFDPYKANTSELHIRQPNPVGVFPNGVSPFGCHEMSGCVFEWVNSVFRPYTSEQTPMKHGEQMVCRGGAWQHSRYRARAAYRGRGNPITRNNDLGFRIARFTREG